MLARRSENRKMLALCETNLITQLDCHISHLSHFISDGMQIRILNHRATGYFVD